MGCAGSKLDDSPAVALCRDRCAFLDEAIRHRFAFAEAHLSYLHSLKSVGVSLDRFFNQDLDGSSHSPPSPVLNLPGQRKGDPPPETSGSPSEKIEHHLDSSSDSGSHLHFHSDESDDDEEDGSGSESMHHHYREVSSPPHQQNLPYGGYFPGYENLNLNLPGAVGGGGGFMNVNYMKNQSMSSVVYRQRPMSPETMQMGESSYYSYPNNHNSNPSSYPMYNNFNNNNNNNSNNNNNYGDYPNYPAYGGGDGFWGGSSYPPPPYGGGGGRFSSLPAVASTSRAPPPPPSPPSTTSWDFLNPFESFEKFYPAYTPNRDSKEVREEEGIPDLEDENDEVIVKEVHGNQKYVDSERSSYSNPGGVLEEDGKKKKEKQYRVRPSVGNDSEAPVEYEVHVVDKKVVDAVENSKKDQVNGVGHKAHGGGFNRDSEVVREIQVQFERASESGSELGKLLEVGKLQYKRKHGAHHVSSKILHLPIVSSQPSTSKSNTDGADPDLLDINQELELRSKNLSSTLHKLYLWEKKLYEEVKVEEKMRVLHELKSRKLKRMDERGAEAHKIDAIRTQVKGLSTKIRIAIQVVDKISVTINILRDEELWPQLNEFIQGMIRMWKSMLDCHHNQCQAIAEAKRLDAIALRKHFNDSQFEATQQLQHELINWTMRFSYWVAAQKGYVQALNNWLMKCLLYVPEETPDGIVPFSPGRIGAPPVFIICNQWWQSLERISEKEVIDSMRDLASNVLQLWDRDKAEMRQRMLANKDERKIKSLEKEDQKIHKEIQALDKRVVLISTEDNNGEMPLTGNVVYQSETSKEGSLKESLEHVLEAMERFATNSLKVYEELMQRVEEDRLSGGGQESVS